MAAKYVAKLVIVDGRGDYLLMRRSQHPTFGIDPDLPGGTLEGGESPLDTMVREVYEEIGVAIDKIGIREMYAGVDYSRHGTHYTLFVAQLDERPEITMSWEHSSYQWLDRDTFLAQAKSAKDTYMHMVYDTLSNADFDEKA